MIDLIKNLVTTRLLTMRVPAEAELTFKSVTLDLPGRGRGEISIVFISWGIFSVWQVSNFVINFLFELLVISDLNP